MKEHDAIPLLDRMDYPHPEMIERAEAFYEEMRKRHTVREFPGTSPSSVRRN